MILCSPSPGTDASDMMIFRFAQAGSVLALYAAQYLNASASLCMNGVPGVMTLLSNLSFFGGELPGSALPEEMSSFHSSALASSSSFASWTDLNRRDRCWFILARGATPSAAVSNG